VTVYNRLLCGVELLRSAGLALRQLAYGCLALVRTCAFLDLKNVAELFFFFIHVRLKAHLIFYYSTVEIQNLKFIMSLPSDTVGEGIMFYGLSIRNVRSFVRSSVRSFIPPIRYCYHGRLEQF